MRTIPAMLIIPMLWCCSITAAESASPHTGIARAQFTSAVRNHEPVDHLTELYGATEEIYFYTELHDHSGQMLIHSWEYRGEPVAVIRLRVDGSRLRVWSSKTLTPDRQGPWTVTVMTQAGEVLAERVLEYNPADPALREKPGGMISPASGSPVQFAFR